MASFSPHSSRRLYGVDASRSVPDKRPGSGERILTYKQLYEMRLNRADTGQGQDGSRMNRWLLGFAISALALTLAGCTPTNVLTLTPDEFDLPACNDLSTVLVEDLGTDRADCNLAGASLTFPDGTEVQLDKYGSGGHYADGLSEYLYSWESVGDYGIVAAKHTEDCSTIEIWGTREARKQLNESGGKSWFCN